MNYNYWFRVQNLNLVFDPDNGYHSDLLTGTKAIFKVFKSLPKRLYHVQNRLKPW